MSFRDSKPPNHVNKLRNNSNFLPTRSFMSTLLCNNLDIPFFLYLQENGKEKCCLLIVLARNRLQPFISINFAPRSVIYANLLFSVFCLTYFVMEKKQGQLFYKKGNNNKLKIFIRKKKSKVLCKKNRELIYHFILIFANEPSWLYHIDLT